MIYGVAIELKTGETQFFAVAANTQRDAREYALDRVEERQIESVAVMDFTLLLRQQYEGVAVLGTGD